MWEEAAADLNAQLQSEHCFFAEQAHLWSEQKEELEKQVADAEQKDQAGDDLLAAECARLKVRAPRVLVCLWAMDLTSLRAPSRLCATVVAVNFGFI